MVETFSDSTQTNIYISRKEFTFAHGVILQMALCTINAIDVFKYKYDIGHNQPDSEKCSAKINV